MARARGSLNSQDGVIEEILKRQKQLLPLNGRTVSKQDNSLYQAAMVQFGEKGWQKALRAAGINPEVVFLHKSWTKQMVQERIDAISSMGWPLYDRSLKKNHLRDLLNAGRKLFGSWQAAIESCGLDYEKVKGYRRKWTPELIIKEIKLLKKKGVKLNAQHIQSIRADLFRAGSKYFGSWGQAVEGAGLSYRQESILWTYKAWLKTLTPEQLKVIDQQVKDFAATPKKEET